VGSTTLALIRSSITYGIGIAPKRVAKESEIQVNLNLKYNDHV
jgi:hypothetical protein